MRRSAHVRTISCIYPDHLKKLQISAVSQDCETVRYIEEPCEKAVIVALKENPGLFMHIHNSSPSRVITTLVEKDMEKKREVGKQEKV